MNNIYFIKAAIEALYKKAPNINIVINTTRTKSTSNIPAKICGVYPNIFCVEELNTAPPKKHSFQYADILIGRVVIKEFPYITETKKKP
ncbi:MAG: hypothetical protein II984_02885 [Clostridia bacterium]|nr:hypothetical protein [Clostridia bacterium]